MIILSIRLLYHIFVNISIALLIFTQRVRTFMDVKKHEEGWALNTHPSYSPIFILTQWQKEGFSHQLHSESEAVGEGVALGNAVHLVHAVLKFSSVSFCLSVSVPSSSSRFRATSFKSSISRLSPRVHCSKGDTFPYQSSLMISILFLPPVSTQQYHRRGRKSRPFSKINPTFQSGVFFDYCTAKFAF